MRNFIVTIDGKSYSVGVDEVESGASIESVVPVQAAAPVAPKAQKISAEGEKVLSPFPGLIKNLLVADGSAVKKDQPIMVLEAMKMDNEITAPCDGEVTFGVVKGANVETNAVLAVLS
ncbi:MAG: biotin/lipoyl-binding protein [Clostridia bacterium]|nr:biotin/lipoyl-binding protein [Clostridia bacterium]